MTSCAACGGATPDGARFCPACGSSLEQSADTAVLSPPATDPSRTAVAGYAAEPHLFGVTPAIALLALGVGSIGVGILLLALGTSAAGAVLVAAGVVLIALFVLSARGRRQVGVGRAAAYSLGTVRDRAAYHLLAFRTAAGAQRELTRRRIAIERLREQRRRLLVELGQATYARDDADAAAARRALERVDAEVAAHEQELARIGAEAHERVRRARLHAQPTETVRVAPREADPPPGD